MKTEYTREDRELLKTFFPEQWQEKARGLGAIVRKRKFDSADKRRLLRKVDFHIFN